MRISDWSSDVCSSDLVERYEAGHPTIGKIFMIERVEDARTADIRDTQDRQRPQMLVTKHRLKAARKRRVGEEAVERSGERRGGKECVRTCRSRRQPNHYKKHCQRLQ